MVARRVVPVPFSGEKAHALIMAKRLRYGVFFVALAAFAGHAAAQELDDPLPRERTFPAEMIATTGSEPAKVAEGRAPSVVEDAAAAARAAADPTAQMRADLRTRCPALRGAAAAPVASDDDFLPALAPSDALAACALGFGRAYGSLLILLTPPAAFLGMVLLLHRRRRLGEPPR
jgi:hypothetical protein